MFKISEFNPNDRTLDEIHAIQRKIYLEDKGLSSDEVILKYRKIREEISKKYNFNFKVVSHKESLH